MLHLYSLLSFAKHLLALTPAHELNAVWQELLSLAKKISDTSHRKEILRELHKTAPLLGKHMWREAYTGVLRASQR